MRYGRDFVKKPCALVRKKLEKLYKIVFLGVVVANFYTVLATIRKTSVCLAPMTGSQGFRLFNLVWQ